MLPALAAGLKYGPAVIGALSGLFGRDKGLDFEGLRRFSDTLRPGGYTTPEDQAAAAGTTARLRRGASASAEGLRVQALRRARQRGIGTAPAMEATLGRIGEAEAVGHEHANAAGEEQLYNAYLGNKRFEQQKALTILGGKLQDAAVGRSNRLARRSAFMNSMLDLSRSALDGMGNSGIGGGSSAGTLQGSSAYDEYPGE